MASKKQYELLFQLRATLGPNFSQSFKNASNTMKLLQTDLKSVNQKLKDVSAYQKRQKAVENSKRRVAELQKEYDRLAEEIKHTDNVTDEQKAALQESAKALAKAKDAAADETERLNEMGNALRQAGVNTDNLSEDTERLRQQYERLQSTQQKVQQINQRQGENKAKIGESKAQLAGIAGGAAAVGAALYNGPIKKAADFQQQMSTVKAIAGSVSDKDLPALTKTAKEMGLTFQTGANTTDTAMNILAEKAKAMGASTKFTAKEAGEAMEFMAMAGWKAGDMMSGIEGVMNLAAASGEELGTVSDIVTDALTAFGLTAADSAHFADVLAQASSNANTNVGMMGETFKYVAPVAGAMGYTAEDTAAMIGLMANSGIKASQAGTSLRKIFLGLQGGVELTGDKLGKYHLEVENADGSMRKLEDVAGDLRKAFSQMTEAEKAANAESIAGKTGMSGLLAIVNASEADYQKLTESIKGCDGAAEEMAKKKLDNFYGQVTLMQSAWDALQVSIGEMFLPALKNAATKATDVLEIANDFVQKNPETVKMIAKIAAGLTGLAAGGLIAKIGFLNLQNGMLGISKVFATIKGIGLEKTVTALTNGFGGLAGAGKGILSYFKGIGSAAGGVASAFGNILGNSAIFSKLGGIMKGVGTKALGMMLKPFSLFGTKLSGILSGLGGVIARSPLGTIAGVIGKGFGKITAFIAPVGNAIKTMLGPVGKLAANVFGPLGGVVGKVLPIVGVITTVVTVIKLVKSHLAEIRVFIKKTFGEEALAVFNKAVSVITMIGDTIRNVFSDGNIGAVRNKIQEIFGEKGVQTFDTLLKVMETVKNAIGGMAQFIITTVIPGVIGFVQAAAPTVMQIAQSIAGFIGQVIPVIADFIAGLMPVIGEVIGFLQTSVLPVVAQVAAFITGTVLPAILTAVQTVLPAVSNVLAVLLPLIQTGITTIWNIISPVIQAILAAVQTAMPVILSVVQTVVETIGGVIQGLMTVLNGIIEFITGVFTGNWRQAWEGVKQIFTGIFESIKSFAKGILDSIGGLVSGIAEKASGLVRKITGGKKDGASGTPVKKFARGTMRTPDTFIAGENGPELITNAPDMRVYTAAQTRNMLRAKRPAPDIFTEGESGAEPIAIVPDMRVYAAAQTRNRLGEAGQASDVYEAPDAAAGPVRAAAVTVNLQSSPSITISGGGSAAAAELKEQLRQYDAELAEKIQAAVLEAIRQEREREERIAYV